MKVSATDRMCKEKEGNEMKKRSRIAFKREQCRSFGGQHNDVWVFILTSLCGVGSDTQHSFSRVQEVAGMVEGVESNDISTCH